MQIHAQRHGVELPVTSQTPYVNSISPQRQPEYPGDREIERRIKSIIRWNAMAMVVRANREHSGIGGHISTFASKATLYEVGANHFFRGPDHASGGDLVYFQGHASPGNYARACRTWRSVCVTPTDRSSPRRIISKRCRTCSAATPADRSTRWEPTASAAATPARSCATSSRSITASSPWPRCTNWRARERSNARSSRRRSRISRSTRSQRVIDRQAKGLRALCKQHGVKLVHGEARFTDAHTLTISRQNKNKNGDSDGGDVNEEQLTFDHAIIATGSRPAPLKLGEDSDTDSDDVITSTQGLDLRDIPKSLLVIGGGYIGLEMGSVYAALGSDVTVVEMTAGLLPGVDDDLVAPLHESLKSRFEEILLRTRVVEMKPYKFGMSVKLVDGDGATHQRRFNKVLVAVGRVPCSDDLGLDDAGVQCDDGGFIKVNAQRCTSAAHIYAIGDVAGQPMLAHKATHEGRVAAEAIADLPTAFEPAAIPAVVFTDPDVAWTGLSETEALDEGIDIRIARFDWRASGRAGTLDRPRGLTKLILQPRTQRVLGVGMIGPHAGELIAGATLAVEMGATAADIHATIHPHPTLSETIMEAAVAFLGQSAHATSRAK